MRIILRPEQELLLQEAINSCLARSAGEALDTLGRRLPCPPAPEKESTGAVARRLTSIGKPHGLSLVGSTTKDLLHVSAIGGRS